MCSGSTLSARAQVQKTIAKARTAQQVWASSGWGQRKRLLRIFNKFMLENAETICRCEFVNLSRHSMLEIEEVI